MSSGDDMTCRGGEDVWGKGVDELDTGASEV